MQPIKIFCSYAPQDKIAVDKLEDHLSILVHQGYIEIWHAGKIPPGANVENERFAQLKQADIILLIVSPDYIASQQCYQVEATHAVQMTRAGIAHVRWIPYRHVMYEEAIFNDCPNLLKDGKFVRDWPNKDKPLHQICQAIDALVSEADLDRSRREANRKTFGDRLKNTHPLPVLPPLKVNRLVKEPEQSKRTAIPAPQKKSANRASTTKRKRRMSGKAVRSATAQRPLDFNQRRQRISRKFGNNRGMLFIILFVIDVAAMPLTIRSWLDSWLLVALVFSLSGLIFSWGILTTDSLLPILLSLVYAGAWAGLILHLFIWPLALWPLIFIGAISIVVACIHYFLFKKR